MPESDDDLLRPTLATDFDVRTFDRPWSPSNLPFAAFFFGPLGGGVLYALNYKRLGSARHARLCLIGAIALTLVFLVVGAWLVTSGMLTTKDRILRFGMQGISAGIGLLLTKHQNGRFRAWEQLGEPPRKLLLPALAIGFSCALVFALLFVVALLAFGFELSSAGPR